MSAAEKARRLAAVEPLVRGMCAKRLGSRGADDAAQAVLEQVWRAQHQQVFDSEEAVRRYAATVARVMPAHDDRRSALAVPTGELGEVLWADEAPGPAELVERAEAVTEARERVAALLGRLSPRERAVIEAVHLGGRSNAEVAEDLGLSASGVRSASVRAMARMRDQLGAASPNPLAHKPSEERSSWDARAAARSAAGVFPQTAGSLPVIEAAKRFALEFDRVPSRRELQELTGASGHTAQHVVAALRAQRGQLYERSTPVRDRVELAAREFAAEHARLPQPGELQVLAAASEHTARGVLRALAVPSGEPVANVAAGESADREAGRSESSPAADRAESVARGLLAEGERFPTWREVADRAEVGRSTAAEALRSLRAEHRTTDQHLADVPSTNGTSAEQPESDEHQVGGHQFGEHQFGEHRFGEHQVDEEPVDSRQPGTAPDGPSAQPGPPAEAEPAEPTPSPGSAPGSDRAAVPDRAAVSQARDVVTRAAVARAAQRTREADPGPDDAADRMRAQQLALWTAADLDTAAARDPTPDMDADASSSDAPGGSDAHAD